MEAVRRWAEAGAGTPKLWLVDCTRDKGKQQGVLIKHRVGGKMEFYDCHSQQQAEATWEGSGEGATEGPGGDPKGLRQGFRLGVARGGEGPGPSTRQFLFRGSRPGERRVSLKLWAESSRRMKEFTPQGPDFL